MRGREVSRSGGLVFLNYRTADERYGAGACFAVLSEWFGAGRVFRDVVSIRPGQRYPDAIRTALGRADVLLVLIGPNWLTPEDPDGPRPVDDPDDWVRREIRTSLGRGIPVVPVLLDGAAIPERTDLPDDIADLAARQAVAVGHADLAGDVGRLASRLVADVPALLSGRLVQPPPAPADREYRWLPSALLRAEREVVPFSGRSGELAELAAWARGPAAAAVELVTGPGGQGKSRLAARLAEVMAGEGWLAGRLPDPMPPEAPLLVSRLDRPVLLVVDYAESRTAEVADLLSAVAGRAPDGAPVRMVLLARSGGAWVDILRRDPRDEVGLLVARMAERRLDPLARGAAQRATEYARAVAAFADRLGLPATGVRAPEDLHRSRYDRVLDLHAAALAALLDAAGPQLPEPGRDPVARVLAHEQRYWLGSAATYDLPDPHPRRLGQVVAAATACGAPDVGAARRLFGALPTFEGAPIDILDRYVEWHRTLYPGPAGLEPLRPDRLGEDLVARMLPVGLIRDLVESCDTDQLVRLLTVLGRAVGRHPALRDTVRDVIAHDPDRLMAAGVAVAPRLEDPRPLVAALTEALPGRSSPADALQAVLEALPSTSLALATFAVTATELALDQLLESADPDPAAVAYLTNDLANRRLAVGQGDAALPAAAEAVRILTPLAGSDDERRADLATAKGTLVTALGALGHHADALQPAREALEIRRTDPDTDPADLIVALLDYGTVLGDLRRHEESAAAAREALELAELLPADHPTGMLPQLALSLSNAAGALGDLGRAAEAVDLAERAVGLCRRLDAAAPDSHRTELIRTLYNLAGAYASVGRPEQAAEVGEESIGLARQLLDRYGPAYRGLLADALHNRAVALRHLHRADESVAAATEAVELYRGLADDRPGIFLPALAGTLDNLARSLSDDGQLHRAVEVSGESVDLYRKLLDPVEEDQELPDALVLLAGLLDDAGESDAAADAAAEAVELYRALLVAGRAAATKGLASALHTLGLARMSGGQPEAAAAAATEAVDLLRGLVEAGDAGRRDELATALHGLGNALDESGRADEGIPALAEAVRIRADLLAESDPDDATVARRDLAAAHHDLGMLLSSAGRHEEALAAVGLAVQHRRVLLVDDDGPAEARTELAESLNNQADTLRDLGRLDQARNAADEAVGLLPGGPGTVAVVAYCTLAAILSAADRAAAVSALAAAWHRRHGTGLDEQILEQAEETIGADPALRALWDVATGEVGRCG